MRWAKAINQTVEGASGYNVAVRYLRRCALTRRQIGREVAVCLARCGTIPWRMVATIEVSVGPRRSARGTGQPGRL